MLLALSRAGPDVCDMDFSAANGWMEPPFWSHRDNADLHSI